MTTFIVVSSTAKKKRLPSGGLFLVCLRRLKICYCFFNRLAAQNLDYQLPASVLLKEPLGEHC